LVGIPQVRRVPELDDGDSELGELDIDIQRLQRRKSHIKEKLRDLKLKRNTIIKDRLKKK
jgi:hypothetical protein